MYKSSCPTIVIYLFRSRNFLFHFLNILIIRPIQLSFSVHAELLQSVIIVQLDLMPNAYFLLLHDQSTNRIIGGER